MLEQPKNNQRIRRENNAAARHFTYRTEFVQPDFINEISRHPKPSGCMRHMIEAAQAE